MIITRVNCNTVTIAGSAPTIEAVNTISTNPPGAVLNNAVGKSIDVIDSSKISKPNDKSISQQASPVYIMAYFLVISA